MHSLGFSPSCTASSLCCRAAKFSSAPLEAKSKPNFYRVLSLDSDAVGTEEIKKAYRSMALRLHPDVCSPSRKEECTRAFIQLRQAFETLSDPALRRKHDIELRGAGGKDGRTRPGFSREVWEAQLCELRRRSDLREGGKVGFAKP